MRASLGVVCGVVHIYTSSDINQCALPPHPTRQPAAGKEYLFISNVDNLGATVDLNLLYYLIDNDIEFCTGAVDITRAETDGGVMVNYKGGLVRG